MRRVFVGAAAFTMLTGVLAVDASALAGTPTAPRSPSAVPGSGRATVKWLAPTSTGGAAITAYVVTPYVAGVAQTARVFNSAATTEIVVSLTNAKTYTFKVAARNANGTGPQSAATSPVTLASPTLVPKTALPTDAQCAARVVAARETRQVNATYNATKGAQKNIPEAWLNRVTGNYSGTTDEILQWAACKWGIDEDIARAQAAKESYWDQQNVGDFQSTPANCLPGHPIGADGQAGLCPASGGLMSIRYQYYGASVPDSLQSTAYNLDYAYAFWRACYTGQFTWLNTVERVGTYAAGDAWGCLGVWFSGRWHTAAANGYIAAVQQWEAERIWTQPQFKTYVHQ